VVRTFKNYKALADKAIAQLAGDDDLHVQIDPDSNSIAVIMKHVAGNLRSRFKDFLTSDGEKPDRHRDGEFEMPEALPRGDLVREWDEAWSIALGSIEALTVEDLDRRITIRGEAFLVPEALNRSATHRVSRRPDRLRRAAPRVGQMEVAVDPERPIAASRRRSRHRTLIRRACARRCARGSARTERHRRDAACRQARAVERELR
jgi:hypothetical protein